jgi:hypothetical protein
MGKRLGERIGGDIQRERAKKSTREVRQRGTVRDRQRELGRARDRERC